MKLPLPPLLPLASFVPLILFVAASPARAAVPVTPAIPAPPATSTAPAPALASAAPAAPAEPAAATTSTSMRARLHAHLQETIASLPGDRRYWAPAPAPSAPPALAPAAVLPTGSSFVMDTPPPETTPVLRDDRASAVRRPRLLVADSFPESPHILRPFVVDESRVAREIAATLERAERDRRDSAFNPLDGGKIGRIAGFDVGSWWNMEEGWTFIRRNKAPTRRQTEAMAAELRDLEELLPRSTRRAPELKLPRPRLLAPARARE